MNAYINYLNDLTNKNNLQYVGFSTQINWVKYSNAIEYESEKSLLLDKLDHKLNWSFKNTKPWINRLSKGCQLCGKGEWSCLFITGKCNANCFYCPTSQNKDGIPSTQGTSFDNVEDYIQYLDYFGFKGASLSGGEPLIVFDRTLHYIKSIKKFFGDKLYLWMYTNGILGSVERYNQLAAAGIDEIRFDIGATNYDLKYLQLAKDIIPNLTVEIPAVPEEFEKLKQVIPELIKMGVKNMNLHQMRLTNYNAPKLLNRDYTYLHGEHATVLESEITALKIIEFVAENNLDIGINYCAFHFKNRFQKAGFRKKIASKFIDSNSQLTENGFLRTISHDKSNYTIDNEQLKNTSSIDPQKNAESIEITYKGLLLDDNEENQLFHKKINIGNKTYFLRSGLVQESQSLNQTDTQYFLNLFDKNGANIPEQENLFLAWKNEFIEWDLRDYF
ncbi:MAG: radical SAM protein [Bacteroidales bacterium]|nr:radical SAM protein [Bacteroidales bacterium]